MSQLLKNKKNRLKTKSTGTLDVLDVRGANVTSQSQNNMNTSQADVDAAPHADASNGGLDIICQTDSYGIKVLYRPRFASLDIVFVHGLTGNAYSTWLHEGTSKHWPRDFLGDDISNARVMTFGYDADVARFWGQVAQDGVSGYANDLLGKLSKKRQHIGNRKIVFVVHSLGGLVTQRALTISRESRFLDLQDIERSTIGICFLGTPHHGADLAKWGRILTNIVNIAKPANSAPVRLLERDSEMLRDVQDGFHNLLEKRKEEGSRIGITCFYETLALFRVLVVPKESAVISGELNYPIRENHVDMTKFSSRKAPGYDDVIGEIQRLANHDSKPSAHVAGTNSDAKDGQHQRSTPSEPAPKDSINNYGSGTMNAITGSGTANINSGNGKMYHGQNLYFDRDD